jgi:hypothetical protein
VFFLPSQIVTSFAFHFKIGLIIRLSGIEKFKVIAKGVGETTLETSGKDALDLKQIIQTQM